ncbi:MAG: hypothetical protein AAGA15_10900 [Pseudomonadota bacterium]
MPLSDKDAAVARDRYEQATRECAKFGRVLAFYNPFNLITITLPAVLSYVAGVTALGVLAFGEEDWALISGAIAVIAGVLGTIHGQRCEKYQSDLANKKAKYEILAGRYDEMVRRPHAFSGEELSALERELTDARALPPAIIRKVLTMDPGKEPVVSR